ncbi:MAG: acyltransferase [Actinomycetota bacterium]|nr:acyltransferase [Actinomycetota bacterium]
MSRPPVPPWDWYDGPLPDNVAFADDCWLATGHSFARYSSERPCGLRVGRRCSIGAGTAFALGPDAEVVFGEQCNVVDAVFATNGRIVFGDRVLVSSQVIVAARPVAVPPAGLPDARYRELMPPDSALTVGDDVWISYRAVVVGDVAIGEGAIIGAGAVIDPDVPAYAVVGGNPARVVGYARPGCQSTPASESKRSSTTRASK